MIRRWWKHFEFLIGLPMGPKTGVWAVDVDTDEEHDNNGIAAWAVLTEEHGEIDTREHLTASKGLHKLLIWDDAHPIGCSRGSMPKGIEIKGRGGYIVVPPSRRKGRAYCVGVDIDPVDAPDWLIELIGTRPVRTDTPLSAGVRQIRVIDGDSIATILDQVPSIHVSNAPDGKGLASASIYVFFIADDVSMEDLDHDVRILKEVVEADLQTLSAEHGHKM